MALGLILAVQGNSCAQNTKKVGQHNFQLPEDWPVEKRGGLVTPIPTEEYVSIKFKEVEKEFRTLKDDFTAKFSGIESALKGIEEELAKEIKKRQAEAQEPGAATSLKTVLADIELVKSELGRLDRKITNKIREMQAELEKLNPKIKAINKDLDGMQTQIYKLDEKVDYYRDERGSAY